MSTAGAGISAGHSQSAAGLQLRDECSQIMEAQGHPDPTGRAKLTKEYHLPAQYVLHTVGPIIQRHIAGRDRRELASCYRSCPELAAAQLLLESQSRRLPPSSRRAELGKS
ncbi:MAG: hypothetical protein HFG10_10525 [Oscillibacter sp.]|nr:hypothetical protein [Oscillibacter sp.]